MCITDAQCPEIKHVLQDLGRYKAERQSSVIDWSNSHHALVKGTYRGNGTVRYKLALTNCHSLLANTTQIEPAKRKICCRLSINLATNTFECFYSWPTNHVVLHSSFCVFSNFLVYNGHKPRFTLA